MVRALVVFGQLTSPHGAVALIHATTKDPIVQASASRTVASHLSSCKKKFLTVEMEIPRVFLPIIFYFLIFFYDNLACVIVVDHRYHIPRSWVKPSGNTLVLFEELGSDPTQLSFATRQAESICSHVSESHPPPVDTWSSDAKTGAKSRPVLQMECPSSDQIISSIKFASFGTPYGACGTYGNGRCSSDKALAIVKQVRTFFLCTPT